MSKLNLYTASIAAVRAGEQVAGLLQKISMQHLPILVIAASIEEAEIEAKFVATEMWPVADWSGHSVIAKRVGGAPVGSKKGVSV